MANYQPNYIYSPLYGNRYMGGSRTPAPSTGGTGQVDTTAIQSRNTAVGVPYSIFNNGLSKNEILLDRKVLADIAVNDAATFEKIVKTAVN